MLETILVILGIVGGFMVSIGWYKRGFNDMEKELCSLKDRVYIMETEGHVTRTDLEVIKQRMGYMEAKIDEIHTVIMRSVNMPS